MKKKLYKICSVYFSDYAKRYLCDQSGATAIEYALIASLIGVMMITGMSAVGGGVNETFISISQHMSGEQPIPQVSGIDFLNQLSGPPEDAPGYATAPPPAVSSPPN